MEKLTINSKHSDSSFEYTEGSYKLAGNSQTDIATSAMTQFNATVFKTTDGVENTIGGVSTNYDQSRGEEGLSYNFYNMGLDEIIAVAPIVKACAEALAAQEASTETAE